MQYISYIWLYAICVFPAWSLFLCSFLLYVCVCACTAHDLIFYCLERVCSVFFLVSIFSHFISCATCNALFTPVCFSHEASNGTRYGWYDYILHSRKFNWSCICRKWSYFSVDFSNFLIGFGGGGVFALSTSCTAIKIVNERNGSVWKHDRNQKTNVAKCVCTICARDVTL